MLAFGLAETSGVLYISDITQFFVDSNLSSISWLINGKWQDLRKLFKYFDGRATFAPNILLSFDMLPIICVLHLIDLPVLVLVLFIL